MSLDISSDVHGHSYLAICVRFLEEDNYERPVTKLFSILPINDSSTGETLFKMISDKIFIEDDIKLNFMGIVSDDGSNMTGEEKGVAQRLKDVYTYIITFKDISHGLNNIFKKALKAIPAHVQSMIISISSHFHRSPQRCSILREILIENDMKPLEILQVSATRWLSMRDSIERILELWSGLEIYFSKHGNDTQKKYFLPTNELWLRVLGILISHIVDCNEYFQRDDLLYHEVYEKLKHSFVTIANIILKKEKRNMAFEKVFDIPFDKKNHKDLREGKFDSEVQKVLATDEELEIEYLMKYDSIKDLLNQAPNNDKKEILAASIKFIYICLNQMKVNLPYSKEILSLCQSIFFEEDFNENKWLKLKDLFPNILRTKKQKDDFATEVRRMEYTYTKIKDRLRASTTKISPLTVWKNESLTYPNMYLLVKALFVLPYSSVPVERVFSNMKDIKNTKRNRLTLDNIEACLLGYQASKSKSFVINEDMIDAL